LTYYSDVRILYVGYRGGDIHTMLLLANGSTGVFAQALRCTGKADCINNAQALFIQSAFSLD